MAPLSFLKKKKIHRPNRVRGAILTIYLSKEKKVLRLQRPLVKVPNIAEYEYLL